MVKVMLGGENWPMHMTAIMFFRAFLTHDWLFQRLAPSLYRTLKAYFCTAFPRIFQVAARRYVPSRPIQSHELPPVNTNGSKIFTLHTPNAVVSDMPVLCRTLEVTNLFHSSLQYFPCLTTISRNPINTRHMVVHVAHIYSSFVFKLYSSEIITSLFTVSRTAAVMGISLRKVNKIKIYIFNLIYYLS